MRRCAPWRCASVCAVLPRRHTWGYRLGARKFPRGCVFGGFLYQTPILERFAQPNDQNRRVQLARIERTAAGAALVADVKARNLDASSVDLLRLVKCAAADAHRWLCVSAPRSAGVLRTREYSSTPGVLMGYSTAGSSTTQRPVLRCWTHCLPRVP